jgi:hypothetical protein
MNILLQPVKLFGYTQITDRLGHIFYFIFTELKVINFNQSIVMSLENLRGNFVAISGNVHLCI